jgi:hypothetical protein
MKHGIEIFIKILKENPKILIIVSSEGKFAEKIKVVSNKKKLNLKVIKWIPPKYFSSFLAIADAFLLILNEEANEISVPSKIYSYLSIKKPILAFMKKSNLAARKIIKYKAGHVFSSQKNELFIKIFNDLISDKKSYYTKSHKHKISNEKRISISKFKKLVEKTLNV